MSGSEPFVPPERQSSQSTCLIVGFIGMAILVAVFILLAMVAFLVPVRMMLDNGSDFAAGKRLPVVNLQPLTGDGRPIQAGDLEGRVVLVNVWATWCPPCKDEFPHMVELYEEFGDRDDFVLLSLPVSKDDLNELRIDTEDFLQRKGADLPTYADRTGATIAGIAEVTGGSTIPRTLVLDRSGTIRRVWIGYRPGSEQDMKRQIEQLLSE